MKVIVAFLKLTTLSCCCLPLILISNKGYQLFFHYAFECPIVLNYAPECAIIPRSMPAKLATYNSQNYVDELGSGLNLFKQCTETFHTKWSLQHLFPEISSAGVKLLLQISIV